MLKRFRTARGERGCLAANVSMFLEAVEGDKMEDGHSIDPRPQESIASRTTQRNLDRHGLRVRQGDIQKAPIYPHQERWHKKRGLKTCG